jgi:hypothetical protein
METKFEKGETPITQLFSKVVESVPTFSSLEISQQDGENHMNVKVIRS